MFNKKSLCCLVAAALFYGGCAQRPVFMPQKEFKEDTDYFIALRKAQSGEAAEAARLFTRAAKYGSPYCAKASAQELTRIGNVQDRKKACMNLIAAYDDDEALLIAAKELFAEGEYAKVIEITENIDYSQSPDALARTRLEAMQKKNDGRRFKEALTWFLKKKLSSEHYQFFQQLKELHTRRIQPQENQADELAQPDTFGTLYKTAAFRIEIYRRNYGAAYEQWKESKEFFSGTEPLLSDTGKALLYGSKDFVKNAAYFSARAKEMESKPERFYAHFYAARLYEKTGNRFTLASTHYKAAMDCAADGTQYDNALWYLLKLNLSKSAERAIAAVKEYCSAWHDPEYFDDFFETLTPILFSERRWSAFGDLYKTLDGHASDAATAKFAYLYGRLLTEKLAQAPQERTRSDAAAEAFTRALKSGSSLYYKIMAIDALGMDKDETERLLTDTAAAKCAKCDEDAERFLLGLAAFGFPERIYPEWKALIAKKVRIGEEAAEKLAAFLYDCGQKKSVYYTQSLRIAATASAQQNARTADMLKALYPRGFQPLVEDAAKKYSIPEEILYALIRTESYFDPAAQSSAGAVGLTQLMDFTASDIAKKLRYGEYSLKSAEDSIEFGSYYVAELLPRLDNRWIPVFFAYNAGITRVRRWMRSSQIEFGRTVSVDLFLETVPYAETRGYGRQLVASAALYAYLYHGTSIQDTVKMLVQKH